MDRVYLSRRNLLILLSKLDRQAAGEQTACMISKHDNLHKTHPQTMKHIEVCAVEDDVYYADRTPGPMLPIDEDRVTLSSHKEPSDTCTTCNGTGLMEGYDFVGGNTFETCYCQFEDTK